MEVAAVERAEQAHIDRAELETLKTRRLLCNQCTPCCTCHTHFICEGNIVWACGEKLNRMKETNRA